jgi:hypothetical protein
MAVACNSATSDTAPWSVHFFIIIIAEVELYFNFHIKPFSLPVSSEVLTAMTMKCAVFWDIKKTSSYFTGNTLLLHYRAPPVNAT